MRLSSLLSALDPISVSGPVDRLVASVTHDSRQAGEADIFVAIVGASVDGRRFAPDLQVAAVIADAPVQVAPGVTTIVVRDARQALAQAAALLAGSPGAALPVIGVTGTNGKTTTCWMLEQIAMTAGMRPGVIGTTGHRIGGAPLPESPLTRYTTPEAPILQQLLAQMREAGCGMVAMEVSSIGLALRRADEIPFMVGVFTGLSRDHLDFHADMDRYLAAKRRLLTDLLAADGRAVLNADDPASASIHPRVKTWRYSWHTDADITAADVRCTLHGTTAQLRTPAGAGTLSIPLIGGHNLENALGAVGAALAIGVPLEAVLAGLAALPVVPGRLERVPTTCGITVLVDYAHSPDALRRVLAGLRPMTTGRILTVFGCGGDRDPGKRPMMGAAASAGSDAVYITSDNPRSEDPGAIIADILPGVTGLRTVQPDRADAIGAAIADARRGDVVLIAGKGHENYQIIGGTTRPFSDVGHAAAALSAREER